MDHTKWESVCVPVLGIRSLRLLCTASVLNHPIERTEENVSLCGVRTLDRYVDQRRRFVGLSHTQRLESGSSEMYWAEVYRLKTTRGDDSCERWDLFALCRPGYAAAMGDLKQYASCVTAESAPASMSMLGVVDCNLDKCPRAKEDVLENKADILLAAHAACTDIPTYYSEPATCSSVLTIALDSVKRHSRTDVLHSTLNAFIRLGMSKESLMAADLSMGSQEVVKILASGSIACEQEDLLGVALSRNMMDAVRALILAGNVDAMQARAERDRLPVSRDTCERYEALLLDTGLGPLSPSGIDMMLKSSLMQEDNGLLLYMIDIHQVVITSAMSTSALPLCTRHGRLRMMKHMHRCMGAQVFPQTLLEASAWSDRPCLEYIATTMAYKRMEDEVVALREDNVDSFEYCLRVMCTKRAFI